MKISYNWLRNYINTNKAAEEIAVILTDCGLEVEGIEPFQSVKGGLEGMVIGEVITKEKHPDADKLSITTVNIGMPDLLNIVCGAPNVAVGQKVIVAKVGAKLFPSEGESFDIKKSKIRGVVSEGMICAEDEIGIGNSHDGILVLETDAIVGMPASDYFSVENDKVFEIGLTPNRADAASHIGVARDLMAAINNQNEPSEICILNTPNLDKFEAKEATSFVVSIEDISGCARYSGIAISNVSVSDSPDWLKNRLKSIGIKPINNVVDITNFVLHETGQPLHAFDADQILSKKICVRKAHKDSNFVTLDGVERKLSDEDLMIFDDTKPLCIAGVMGGLESGVTSNTLNIFLESAYFNPVSVRKTAKRYSLSTDASFRFERGTDPNMTLFALKRAALLIEEIAGGQISSNVIDHYPQPIEDFKIHFFYKNCSRLIGKELDSEVIKKIITSLGIKIDTEHSDGLNLTVPSYKVDVQREVDVIEEILRIYGYNRIEIPLQIRSSAATLNKPDKEKYQQIVSELLVAKGFFEIMSLSLIPASLVKNKAVFDEQNTVNLLNPLSNDLNSMRRNLLFGGLKSISYNQNRKRSNLLLFEFGKSYQIHPQTETKSNTYSEKNLLALFAIGNSNPESWTSQAKELDFFSLKSFVNGILERIGIPNYEENNISNDLISSGLRYEYKQKKLVEFGLVANVILKQMDIKSTAVFFAEFDWDNVIACAYKNIVEFSELPKFPEVRRDLALLLNKETSYLQVKEVIMQTEKKLLREVNLFDVYQGEKLESEKKSYAVSLLLQNEDATLNDKQIEAVMNKIIRNLEEKLDAKIR